jgi:hypothetical protein
VELEIKNMLPNIAFQRTFDSSGVSLPQNLTCVKRR